MTSFSYSVVTFPLLATYMATYASVALRAASCPWVSASVACVDASWCRAASRCPVVVYTKYPSDPDAMSPTAAIAAETIHPPPLLAGSGAWSGAAAVCGSQGGVCGAGGAYAGGGGMDTGAPAKTGGAGDDVTIASGVLTSVSATPAGWPSGTIWSTSGVYIVSSSC